MKLQDQELLDFGIKNSFHRKKILTKVAKCLLEPKNCVEVKMAATKHVDDNSIEGTRNPFSMERKQKRSGATKIEPDSVTKSRGNRHRT